MRTRVVRDDAVGRAAAIDVLAAGGLVGLPTDTVYGIAAALSIPGAIERIFAAKRRPPEKGIVLLLAEAAQAAGLAVVTPPAAALMSALWPGALTLVMARRPGVALPEALTGGAPSIGLRVPAHGAPRTLAAAVGPLPTTSANRSGEPDARDAEGVVRRLGDALDLVLDGGPAPGGVPSTVVDCSGSHPLLLRAGAIPLENLNDVLDRAGLARIAVPDVPAG